MTLKTVLVEWWNGQKLPHILKDGMADNLPQILECMAWFWTMAGCHRKLFNRLVSNSLCKIVWKLIISTKLRLRGMHTYFESKIGMTGSPILSFAPSLHRKITIKKERLRKRWSAFFCCADKESMSIKNLHVCSEHFETKQIVKTLSWIKRLPHGMVPTIFNKYTVCRSPHQHEKGSNKQIKWDAGKENIKEVL